MDTYPVLKRKTKNYAIVRNGGLLPFWRCNPSCRLKTQWRPPNPLTQLTVQTAGHGIGPRKRRLESSRRDATPRCLRKAERTPAAAGLSSPPFWTPAHSLPLCRRAGGGRSAHTAASAARVRPGQRLRPPRPHQPGTALRPAGAGPPPRRPPGAPP